CRGPWRSAAGLLVALLLFAAGLLGVYGFGLRPSIYYWLLVWCVTAGGGFAAIWLLALGKRRHTETDVDRLAKAVRRRLVNQQCDQPLAAAEFSGMAELADAINRLLGRMRRQPLAWAQDKHVLETLARNHEHSLQQAIRAGRRAHEKS